MKDIRIYYYEAGTLKKRWPINKSYPSLEEGLLAIKRMKSKGFDANRQFVLVEYTGKYKSQIIEVI